jgi:RNA polymerase sigma factor (sigma-70 family)
MKRQAKPHAPDLSALTDAELVLAARDPQRRQAAIDALVARYHDCLCRLIARLARRAHLPPDQLPDAQQDAVVAMIDAISAYDPIQDVRSRPCSFKSFLWAVLRARFYNFVRGFRRGERHLDRCCQADDTQPSGSAPLPLSARRGAVAKRLHGKDWSVDDRAEFRACLERAQRQLGARARWLWEQAEAGQSLKEVARHLGISYDRAKRWRQRIRARLAEQLREWN